MTRRTIIGLAVFVIAVLAAAAAVAAPGGINLPGGKDPQAADAKALSEKLGVPEDKVATALDEISKERRQAFEREHRQAERRRDAALADKLGVPASKLPGAFAAGRDAVLDRKVARGELTAKQAGQIRACAKDEGSCRDERSGRGGPGPLGHKGFGRPPADPMEGARKAQAEHRADRDAFLKAFADALGVSDAKAASALRSVRPEPGGPGRRGRGFGPPGGHGFGPPGGHGFGGFGPPGADRDRPPGPGGPGEPGFGPPG